MEDFKNLKRVALNEARKLDAAYANKDEFSDVDMKKYDCIMHALKSQLTAEAMMEAEEYEEEGGMSGRRGRAANGRYVSRDMGRHDDNMSYAEGYNQGYSEAMNRMQNQNGTSGHYPMMPMYDGRRW